MSDPLDLLERAVGLIGQHLTQIRIDSTRMTKEGPRGLTDRDAGVIEKYTKLLLIMTKQSNETQDETDNLSDAELEEKARLILEETTNATETSESE